MSDPHDPPDPPSPARSGWRPTRPQAQTPTERAQRHKAQSQALNYLTTHHTPESLPRPLPPPNPAYRRTALRPGDLDRAAPSAPHAPTPPQTTPAPTTAALQAAPTALTLTGADRATSPHSHQNDRQSAFLRHMLRTGYDAVASARLAGYPEPVIDGPVLASQPDIKRALQIVASADVQLSDVTPARVMRELASMALHKPGDIYDERGAARPLHLLPENVKASIKSVEQTANGTRYKLVDKVAAISLLADLMGMKTTKVDVQHSGEVGLRVNLDSLSEDEINQLLEANTVDAEYTEVPPTEPTKPTDEEDL